MQSKNVITLIIGLLIVTGCRQEATKTFTFKHRGCQETFERIGTSYNMLFVDGTDEAVEINNQKGDTIDKIYNCPACGKPIIKDSVTLLKERQNN